MDFSSASPDTAQSLCPYYQYYQGQSFRIDIFKLADQKINPKGLTPIAKKSIRKD